METDGHEHLYVLLKPSIALQVVAVWPPFFLEAFALGTHLAPTSPTPSTGTVLPPPPHPLGETEAAERGRHSGSGISAPVGRAWRGMGGRHPDKPPHLAKEKTEGFHPRSPKRALSALQGTPGPEGCRARGSAGAPSRASHHAGCREAPGSELRTYPPTLYPGPQ